MKKANVLRDKKSITVYDTETRKTLLRVNSEATYVGTKTIDNLSDSQIVEVLLGVHGYKLDKDIG